MSIDWTVFLTHLLVDEVHERVLDTDAHVDGVEELDVVEDGADLHVDRHGNAIQHAQPQGRGYVHDRLRVDEVDEQTGDANCLNVWKKRFLLKVFFPKLCFFIHI